MSIQLPPSESKGMSMREYQRIYPHALSQQTLTESRMVHRAMMHRLNKDRAEWKSFYRWQRIKSLRHQISAALSSSVGWMLDSVVRGKAKLVKALLNDRPESMASQITLKLPNKIANGSSKSPVAYRF